MVDDYRTYKEWKDLGYVIKRGEKSIGRNMDGVPVFAECQVVVKHKKKTIKMIYNNWEDDEYGPYDDDGFMNEECF